MVTVMVKVVLSSCVQRGAAHEATQVHKRACLGVEPVWSVEPVQIECRGQSGLEMRCSVAADRGKALWPARQGVIPVGAHGTIAGLLSATAVLALLAVRPARLHEIAVTAADVGD